MKKEELSELLRKGDLVVTFIKKDGTERIMNCTQNVESIPYEFKSKTDEIQSQTSTNFANGNFVVWDLDKEAWRMFNIDRVTHVAQTKKNRQTVTEELLSQMNAKYYGDDYELKVGDEITFGFTEKPIPLTGISQEELDALDGETDTLTLRLLVSKDGVLYELYSNKTGNRANPDTHIYA